MVPGDRIFARNPSRPRRQGGTSIYHLQRWKNRREMWEQRHSYLRQEVVSARELPQLCFQVGVLQAEQALIGISVVIGPLKSCRGVINSARDSTSVFLVPVLFFLEELSMGFTVCCDPHNQKFQHIQWGRSRCFSLIKSWGYQTTLPASWEICMQVKKQESEPNKEQWTGSKLGKEYIKAVYYHPA